MGMYTELIIKCEIKKNLPSEVLEILNYLFGNTEDLPMHLPDHEFFACSRWSCIGRCYSYYHHPRVVNSFVEGYLFSRSDLKNYEDEIEKFIDWIKPYVDEFKGKCIGWSWYEEADEPTLIII